MNDKRENELIGQRIQDHCFVVKNIWENKALLTKVVEVANEIIGTYQSGGKLFLCGNGGSAADAQHLAAELVGRFYMERSALSAEALTANTSILTALANDYDYEMIFARQIEAKGKAGDVLVGITTSGTSKNILAAFEQAREQGLKTVLMMGEFDENKHASLMHLVDYLIAIPSKDTPRIQECHIMLGHILCEVIEKELF